MNGKKYEYLIKVLFECLNKYMMWKYHISKWLNMYIFCLNHSAINPQVMLSLILFSVWHWLMPDPEVRGIVLWVHGLLATGSQQQNLEQLGRREQIVWNYRTLIWETFIHIYDHTADCLSTIERRILWKIHSVEYCTEVHLGKYSNNTVSMSCDEMSCHRLPVIMPADVSLSQFSWLSSWLK